MDDLITQEQKAALTETIATLNSHVSIRDFRSTPIDDELLWQLLRAAQRAPTSSNMQAYSFVVIRNAETKARLAELAGNQRHIAECPVFICVCADITRIARACELHGTTLAQNTENTLVATVDAAIAGMSLAVAAESVGLGTVMIGGMRNHPREVAELLGFPKGVFVVYGMCLGWPAVYPPQKPRLPENAVVHFERYHPTADAVLQDYDRALAAHYRAQGRKTPDAAWTGVIAKKFSRPQRPDLRAVLEELGFSFN
ncbi:MAG: hypothetical protein CUN55_02660 [Phototrophicales bacterium]|nr:MAG: hypothetical protein CUN55_02660 [Phototrophicales bacterium]